eukprot:CAMPEP_0172479770 /NCGR_PEP_ID=MMETSP1066-20121228/4576_1 /TAXON_ID=671091 /ORGANISM="Coscinodiscus wailesii, Strain CCMP2513" /LENGTH=209 /DNA_ID=CAMNT_0013240533 /DNA_START=40 /DNA_END=669 /DNA_ORIENTATION=-
MRITAGVTYLVLGLHAVNGFVAPRTKISNTPLFLGVEDAIAGNEAIIGGAVASIFAGAAALFSKSKDEAAPATTTRTTTRTAPPTIDVSIPYDAAARLAYSEFLSTNSDTTMTFETFQPLYLSMTSAEMAAKSASMKMAALKNGKAEDAPLGIPYDAAARLAYDEWRVANQKGEFDEEGFEAFKPLYESLASAEVTSKAAKAKLDAMMK